MATCHRGTGRDLHRRFQQAVRRGLQRRRAARRCGSRQQPGRRPQRERRAPSPRPSTAVTSPAADRRRCFHPENVAFGAQWQSRTSPTPITTGSSCTRFDRWRSAAADRSSPPRTRARWSARARLRCIPSTSPTNCAVLLRARRRQLPCRRRQPDHRCDRLPGRRAPGQRARSSSVMRAPSTTTRPPTSSTSLTRRTIASRSSRSPHSACAAQLAHRVHVSSRSSAAKGTRQRSVQPGVRRRRRSRQQLGLRRGRCGPRREVRPSAATRTPTQLVRAAARSTSHARSPSPRTATSSS